MIEQSLHSVDPVAPVSDAATGNISQSASSSTDNRPLLAIVTMSMPPYRIHVHRRIIAEIPEVRLVTLLTHPEDARWAQASTERLDVLPVYDRDQPNESSWHKAGRIIAWMAQHRPSAVVLIGYSDLGRVRLIRWCRRARIPCFIWADSNIEDDRGGWLKQLLLRRFLAQVTGVLPCGERGKAYFRRYGVSDERMFLFPVEPDYDLIRALPPQRIDEVTQRYDLSPNRRRLIYSGRLVAVKRVDLLIDAFAGIAAQRPAWDLVIAGDGPLFGELQQRVPSSLAARVRWTGHVPEQSLVSALYRASDALVLPSDFEPWALVINEAAAAGLAIVSSSVPGASAELVRDGVNGRIFRKGSLTALTACLHDVTQPGQVDEMKRASPAILEDWRRRGDPIDGLRAALAGVLGGRAAAAHQEMVKPAPLGTTISPSSATVASYDA